MKTSSSFPTFFLCHRTQQLSSKGKEDMSAVKKRKRKKKSQFLCSGFHPAASLVSLAGAVNKNCSQSFPILLTLPPPLPPPPRPPPPPPPPRPQYTGTNPHRPAAASRRLRQQGSAVNNVCHEDFSYQVCRSLALYFSIIRLTSEKLRIRWLSGRSTRVREGKGGRGKEGEEGIGERIKRESEMRSLRI